MKNEIRTIQKREKLNNVYTLGNTGAGGAYHRYEISRVRTEGDEDHVFQHIIQFQDGARNIEGSIPGIIDTDLLEIVRHRLMCFQQGDFASGYNAEALINIEKALVHLNNRIEDRINRNALGKNIK